jgi:hypothetical protein
LFGKDKENIEDKDIEIKMTAFLIHKGAQCNFFRELIFAEAL